MPLLITVLCCFLSIGGTPPVETSNSKTPPPASATTTATPSQETRSRAAGWGDRSWQDQHDDGVRFLRASPHPRGSDLVLLGDSITQSFGGEGRQTGQPGRQALVTALPDLVIANQGISGDRTQHLLWRIQRGALGDRPPPVVAVLIGTNNLPHDDPPAIAAGIEAVVMAIQKRHPGTLILLHAIPPRGVTAADPMRTQVRKTNLLIRRLADQPNVRWLNPWSVLVDAEGHRRPGYLAADGVHLGADGYRIWAETLAAVSELRADDDSSALNSR